MPIWSRVLTNDEIINRFETISKEIDALKGNLRDTSKVGVLSENDFLLHEYDALRAEIAQRTSVRFTIITITITAFAAVFAFSSTSVGVYLLMLYPGLSLLFMGTYFANSYGIRRCEKYIKDVIEHKVREDNQVPNTSKIGWSHRGGPGGYLGNIYLSLNFLANNMLFPVSSLITWVAACIIIFTTKFSTLSNNGINLTYLALWFSLAVILISFFIVLFAGKLFNAALELS